MRGQPGSMSTETDQQQSPAPNSRGIGCGPLSWIFVLLVALVLVGVFVGPSLREHRMGVFVATREIRRGDVVTEDYFALGTHGGSRSSLYAARVDGRLALRDIAAGGAIRERDLGPTIAAVIGRDSTIVAVHAPDAGVLRAVIRPGDAVRVLLRPAGRSQQELFGVVVDISNRRSRGAPRGLELAVVMRRSAADHYLRASRDARVMVVRDLAKSSSPKD